MEDSGKESLIHRKTADTVTIELNKFNTLPPEWVDYYDRTVSLIEEAKKLCINFIIQSHPI